jgi:hypothetical protein
VFRWFGGTRRRLEAARELEGRGELDAAARAYTEAEAPEESSRVLLLAAESEVDPERRLARYAHVASLVGAAADEAARRRAQLGFELARQGVMSSELVRVADELASVGLHREAAEAARLAGDTEAELRALEQAGAIPELEARYAEIEGRERLARERAALVAEARDRDAVGERRGAIEALDRWLATHSDEELLLQRGVLEGRCLQGPVVALTVDGERRAYVLGREVILGRSDADLVVPAPAVSRRQLRFYRAAGGCYVDDLGTRNGTFLAGQRLAGPLAIQGAMELALAGELPCTLELDADGCVVVGVSGVRYHLPLGPVRVLGWELDVEPSETRSWVMLRTPPRGTPPFREAMACGPRIELAEGDRFATERGGAVRLECRGSARR